MRQCWRWSDSLRGSCCGSIDTFPAANPARSKSVIKRSHMWNNWPTLMVGLCPCSLGHIFLKTR